MITKIPAPDYPAEESRYVSAPVTNVKLEDAALAINSAFTFADTAEGWAFWEGVYTRLRNMARGEPLK